MRFIRYILGLLYLRKPRKMIFKNLTILKVLKIIIKNLKIIIKKIISQLEAAGVMTVFLCFRQLIRFTTDESVALWKGYVYAAAFFVVSIVQSVFFHQLFHISMTMGMRMKSALIAAIYKKVIFTILGLFYLHFYEKVIFQKIPENSE